MKKDGFTLIELTVVVAVAAIVMTFGALAFTGFFERNAARHAAQIFAQDLIAARSFAVRSQEPVVIRFYETTLWYEVDMAGDSLVFDRRGVADMSGAGGALGVATFSSGAVTYTVSFNGMGASKIEQT